MLNAIKKYVSCHLLALKWSIAQLNRSRLTSWMTCLVVGMALALPAVFFVFLFNVELGTAHLGQNTQISVFLKMDVSAEAQQALVSQIQSREDVQSVRYISPSEGLKELQSQGGLKTALNQLSENPLPGVIEVIPYAKSSQSIEALWQVLQALPEVESTQLDKVWIQRLQALLTVGSDCVMAFGILLGLAVIVIIYHIIQLSTQQRYQAIRVLALIGATPGFIRRPFLYTGLLYGMAGGLLSWIFVDLIVWALSYPVSLLANTYQAYWSITGLDFIDGLGLACLGGLLGWLGAWIAVAYGIRQELIR